MTTHAVSPSFTHLISARCRIESRGKFLLILSAIPVAMAFFSLYAYIDLASQVAAGTERTAAMSADWREQITTLNPASFAALASVDFFYKAYFSIAMILVGLAAWRIVGVTASEGIHKYYLLGGRTRTSVALNTAGVLAAFVGGLVGIGAVASFVAGLIGYAGRIGAITVGQLGTFVVLYTAAVVPLLSYAIVVALLTRLHMPRVALLIVSVCLPLIIGILDTLTPTKHWSPWGILSFFPSFPSLDAQFLGALAIEGAWLLSIAGAFLWVSSREQVMH